MLRTLLVSALLMTVALPATAAEPAPGTPIWAMTAKGGVSIFTGSNSPALTHLVHPVMRLEGTYR
ncbi:MAG: hypothetical protein QF464_10750, partial [Myxococcota bacterium]|nr:hypothetical protein [Myxococcota bacterium]